jgi:hypothetical protein
MKALRFLPFLLLAPAAAASAQQALGVHGLWAAFRDAGRCWAISEPVDEPRAGDARGFASIGYWPGRVAGGQAYFRLSRAKREGSAVLLRIDARTFQLRAGGDQAWAADAAADAEVVAAMRTGIAMSVETRSASGALVRDVYRLRGAATAIDAAAIRISAHVRRSTSGPRIPVGPFRRSP